MAIPDSDPRARDLDSAFEAAMSGPARPRAAAGTPAEIDRDAPHGRDEQGEPLAPFGWTKPQRKDEPSRPKLAPGGRKSKDDPDRPRTATVTDIRRKPDEGKPAPAAIEPHDWTAELDGLADAAWFGLSAAGKLTGSVPVLGKLLPERKMAAQAYVLAETKPRLVGAVNLAAQHNARAAAFCASLESGNGLWALTCMFMVMPIVSLSASIWKGDEQALKAAELPGLDDLAAMNDRKLDEMLASIQARITGAAEPGGQAPDEQPAEPAAG